VDALKRPLDPAYIEDDTGPVAVRDWPWHRRVWFWLTHQHEFVPAAHDRAPAEGQTYELTVYECWCGATRRFMD
jgi:hypothetical protein